MLVVMMIIMIMVTAAVAEVVVHAVVAVRDDHDDHLHGTDWPVVSGVVIVADSQCPRFPDETRGAMTLRTLIASLAKVNVLRIAPLCIVAHLV